MPDRVRARAVLTALLILLTVAGIHVLGPPGDWGIGRAGKAVAVGVVLEVVLAGLMTWLLLGRRPSAEAVAGKLNRMLSRCIVVVMIGIFAGILVSFYKPALHPYRPPVVRVPKIHGSRHAPFNPANFHFSFPIGDILIAIVILAIIWMVLMAVRYRLRARFAQMADIDITDVADEDLARAVESGRMALRDLDDARAAIIACYVAMEQSLAEAGAARGAAETPDELLARAVSAGLVSPGPAGVLTRLFYEARFSTHPMPRSQRDQAERALADLAAGLGTRELT